MSANLRSRLTGEGGPDQLDVALDLRPSPRIEAAFGADIAPEAPDAANDDLAGVLAADMGAGAGLGRATDLDRPVKADDIVIADARLAPRAVSISDAPMS